MKALCEPCVLTKQHNQLHNSNRIQCVCELANYVVTSIHVYKTTYTKLTVALPLQSDHALQVIATNQK